MSSRNALETEMPAPGEGRPLGGQLDSLDALFDFQATFEAAVDKTISPDSNTRQALHELVCITSTRLHIERVVLVPLLGAHPDATDYREQSKRDHHRIEVLLALIDRRGVSDPEIPSMFQELQDVVRSNLGHQREAADRVRSGLSDQQIQGLSRDLQKAVDTAMTRPHPHLPPAGRIRRLSARLDRVRNRTSVR
jgi:hypothetical protein